VRWSNEEKEIRATTALLNDLGGVLAIEPNMDLLGWEMR
jgi:hypothetical protein